ncbi:MAG: type IV secretion system protein [Sporichthyaceae bacterium]
MTAANLACVGPLDPLCNVVGGVVGSATDAGSGFVLDALGHAFVRAAESVTTTALAALDTGTRVDLGADWFRANVAVIGAVTLPVVMGLLVAQVMTSVLRREPGGLARAAVGLGKAFLGAALALSVTQASLIATDGICEFIAASSGTTVHGAAERFLNITWLAGPTAGPVLQMLLGIGIIIGCLALWAVLLFRKAALLLVAVFAPIAFAGAVWDQTRVWARRWSEIVVALVLCKVVIVVTFVLGASAFTGTGPSLAADGAMPDPALVQSAGLSDVLVGLILLAIASFAPWLTFKFVHWGGMEAASVMHSSMAANPISRAGGAAGTQARSAAQQALTSSVTAGAGGAAAARRGGASRASGSGAASLAAGLGATRPTKPGGNSGPTSRKDER